MPGPLGWSRGPGRQVRSPLPAVRWAGVRRGRAVNLPRGWRCQSFVSGVSTDHNQNVFRGAQSSQFQAGPPREAGRPRAGLPLCGCGLPPTPGLLGSSQIPRLLRAPGMGVVCPASARAAVGFLAPHRKDSRGLRPFSAFRGPHFPQEAPGSLRSRTHKPGASPQPSRRPPARPLQPSEAAIGPRRRGGVRRRPRPRLPLALEPLRLAVGSTSHGLGRPARRRRPEAGPAPPASRPRLPPEPGLLSREVRLIRRAGP